MSTNIRCTVHPIAVSYYGCRHHPTDPEAGNLCPAHQAEATAILKAINEEKPTDYSDPEGLVKEQFREGMAIALKPRKPGASTLTLGTTEGSTDAPLHELLGICPAHYAGAVTPWDLQKCMKSSGNAFVDARRTDAIEYAFRVKGDLLGDLIKARHCLDEAITVLKAAKNA